METQKTLEAGTKVKIHSDAIHQNTQKPLDGMTGEVKGKSKNGFILVAVTELGGEILEFLIEELIELL